MMVFFKFNPKRPMTGAPIEATPSPIIPVRNDETHRMAVSDRVMRFSPFLVQRNYATALGSSTVTEPVTGQAAASVL